MAVLTLTAACTAAFRADDARLRIHGAISPGLRPELILTLNASNPFCWGKGKVVETIAEIQDGKFDLIADWDPEFCGYTKGTALLTVNGRGSEKTHLEILFGNSATGFVEFHEVASIRCADDPEFGQFDCTCVREDASSIIGTHLYIDPAHSSAEYHLDLLDD